MANESEKDIRSGVVAALAAYTMWGLFPLMFRALAEVPSPLIVAHRIVWALLFVSFVLWQRKRLAEVLTAMKDLRTVRTVFFATIFLTANWLVYVWAVESEQTLAASFGYFILPLVNMFMGMVLLGERQNRLQWIAITIATIAIVIQAWGIGSLPWVSLVLAGTFGVYGYIRKTVNVGSAPGLAIETLILFPFAAAYILFVGYGEGIALYADPWIVFWLIASGPATAGALLFFAFAARQLRLTTLGMFQYLAPSMHFVIAVFLFGEAINALTLFSFVLIWISLAVYSFDSFKNRKHRQSAPSVKEGIALK